MSTSAAANGNGADQPVDTENWVNIQKKTFTKWCNNHLAKKGYPLIENSQTDFETGVMLMHLIHALYPHVHIPKFNHHPKLRPHKLDNIVIALKMVEDAKVKTNFLKSTHLIDHDLKMILGMQWAIILDYAIKGINVEELTAKEGLLLWVRKKTSGYRDVDPPGVQNFTRDFRNGLVLCALIHRHRPDLLNYDELSKENAEHNIELAFSVAEKQLGIPRLLDVEDLTTEKPDERSVITYVSEYFHKFSAGALKEQAARRTARFVKFQRNIYQMRHNYEKAAKELLSWTINQTREFSDAKFPETLEDILSVNSEFKQFVLTHKPPKAAQKLDLEALFAEIQTQLKVNNRPPYIPPQEISPDSLDEAWNSLWNVEQIYARQAKDQRFKFIKKQEYKVDETKIQEFTEAFNHFDSNNDNELDKTEFKAALSAIGVDFKEDTFVKLFDAIREGNAGINLQGYINFLVEREQDKDTPEQLTDSFKTLADDQPYISTNQLANGGLPVDDVQFLSETMAPNENGELDYVHYVEESFVHY